MGILTKKDQREIINKLLPTSCKFPENNLMKNKCLAIHNGLKYKIIWYFKSINGSTNN